MNRHALNAQSSILLVSLSLVLIPTESIAQDTVIGERKVAPIQSVIATGNRDWPSTRISQSEPEELHQYDTHIEPYFCSCFDRPRKHYPYSMVIIKTAKGEFVARPEGSEGDVHYVPLAIRFGNRYCETEMEQNCYGTFSHPCDFTDFRYGEKLRAFFPTCKADEAD